LVLTIELATREVVMNDDGKREVVGEVLDAFNRHDLDTIMSHFAEDCVFESPRGPDAWGRRFVGRRRSGTASLPASKGSPTSITAMTSISCPATAALRSGPSAALRPRARELKYAVATSGPSTRTGSPLVKDSFWKIRELA
jgi:SnoaL-like protein